MSEQPELCGCAAWRTPSKIEGEFLDHSACRYPVLKAERDQISEACNAEYRKFLHELEEKERLQAARDEAVRKIREDLKISLEGHAKEIVLNPTHENNEYCEGYIKALRFALTALGAKEEP